ncbi:MAG: CHC2 zinc finger domain-containing protein, partial [Limisphaerales bacterium]
MPPPQNDERREAISKLAAEANISEVAEWLGLRVVGRGTASPKTLCPFHDDRRPSMQLYTGSGGRRAQFHCFACGAHGDVFDLIKKQLGKDFQGALEWLAERRHVRLPTKTSTTRTERNEPRKVGLKLGFTIYRRQSNSETEELRKWAADRDIDFSVLQDVEVFAAFPPKIARSASVADREQVDSLDAAGLLLRGSMSRGGESLPLAFELAPRDFYSTPRILFTIRDDRGEIAGFAGRAIGKESPKYLFSPGFPRGSTLYRFHKVRSARPRRGMKGDNAILDIFVVEGLMDALRLEAIGLHAVALLGSQITDKQVKVLTDFASDLDRDNLQLAVHLFLDADEAGHRGAVNATVKLLDASVENPGLLLDVLMPPAPATEDETCGHDPDELFRDVKDTAGALARLSAWAEAPMKVLLAAAVEAAPAKLDDTWETLPESQQLRAFRDVERRLDRVRWVEILDRVPAFESQMRASTGELSRWKEPLRRFLRASSGKTVPTDATVTGPTKVDDGRLIRALQIAEASTQRREFPVDEGSWERLQAAIDVTIPHLRSLLEVADDKGKLDADKMLAVLVPKGDGRFRLKALPSPEILSLQQYVLNELLRDYANCPRFRRFIPGVRFTASSTSRRLETTGEEKHVPVGGETVSFAYTLDMDVIEHRTPPRRTGMFRSYYECWRDFISFIDSRVAAIPSGQFHVARLDVRSFYPTVPRAAVNAVLLPALKGAMAELANSDDRNDALACAPLFLPTFKEPSERAEKIVDWLCDQSFGYDFEPTGTVPQENPGGLPQGPDLSAYLANISLFPLDHALSELVAKLDRQASDEQGEVLRGGQMSAVRGAVYARYVDDMVIIARTATDLARLRTAIEQQLALIGMELSPKTDPLPVMDEAEVRNWLTERRGAGLGVSGPFDGPPANSPLSLLEPLADAGETDRSDSLRVLHDPRLEDPDTPQEELESAIETVLAAPDLRHGDNASVARHLWRGIIQEAGEAELVPADAANKFKEIWKTRKPPQRRSDEVSSQDFAVADLLAWLDGIERFLTSRQDRNPTLSELKHKILNGQRNRMAALVHGGLCEALIGRVLPSNEPSRFEHMLILKRLVIHRAATLVQPPSSPTELKVEAGESLAKARLLISLAEAQGSAELLDRASWRAAGMPLGILFHEAVARLRIANRPQRLEGPDPLMPVDTSMALWRQRGETKQPLENVLNLWMPHLSASHTPAVAEAALSSFVNLVSRHAVDLVDKRPALRSFALDGSAESPVQLLPTPPGINVPGLLGLRDENRVVLRADLRDDAALTLCPQLAWTEKPGGAVGRLKRYESPLLPYQYLQPLNSKSHPGITRWLARAFRSLVTATGRRTSVCPPTASNLLGPPLGADTEDSQWEVLGFCVPAFQVCGQAFLRQREGGLVMEPVLELNDPLWRVGTALADWLDRAQSTRQLSSQRLTAPALVGEAGEDWAREKMLHFSLCRLRGSSLPARPLRISVKTGMPTTVERVLLRLEQFPTESDPTNTQAGLAHLIATLAEGRAIQARLDTRIDPSAPGGATALLVEMVRGQFRADEELAHRLPASETPLPSWAPTRRPPRALYALGERLAALAELDPMRGIDKTLCALASATRLLAIELQLRSQALELWSLLELPVRLEFQESPPSLADWNLDSTALLHREQPTPLEGAQIATDWRNVRELFQKLHRATSEGQRVDWVAIAGITPLGWMVVLGALTGAFPGDWRGGLVQEDRFGTDARSQLKIISDNLALAGADGDDLPWGGLEDAIEAWDSARLQETFTTLGRLDTAAGLRIETHESSRFYLEASRRRPTEVQTSDGRRQLSGWAIVWAKAFDESRGGIERIAAPLGENRVVFRWSESWCGDRLVGIGVVQPGMVALAGEAFAARQVSAQPIVPVTSQLASAPSDQIVEPTSEVQAIEASPAMLPAQAALTPLPPPQTAEEKPPSAKTPNISEGDIGTALSELARMQGASWDSRGEKPPSHVRVALFQWEVDESYRHPGFDLCDESSPRFNRKKPEEWIADAFGRSCAEHRRRALLKAALKACNLFNVDVLLLPEYSMRPDTVEWLAQQLPTIASKTSVWAGTYRLPPGMLKPTDSRDWSAIHEVVLPDPVGARKARPKKYPAPAADEVFYPGGEVMEPLIADQKLGDVRSHIYELICSEVFLVTFPANLFPLARLRRELLGKFGASGRCKDLDGMIREDVMADIKKFALLTAISESLGIRRTILLVPAMTSRSADYSVLGQAAFLSSGITTIFCNAVCASYGHGQSCFIGHDGWLDEKHGAGFPTTVPYHG